MNPPALAVTVPVGAIATSRLCEISTNLTCEAPEARLTRTGATSSETPFSAVRTWPHSNVSVLSSALTEAMV